MSKTYAYVTSETCCVTRAELPGHIGQNGRRISRHGDYNAWTRGKRETLDYAETAPTLYGRKAARAVAWLLGWE